MNSRINAMSAETLSMFIAVLCSIAACSNGEGGDDAPCAADGSSCSGSGGGSGIGSLGGAPNDSGTSSAGGSDGGDAGGSDGGDAGGPDGGDAGGPDGGDAGGPDGGDAGGSGEDGHAEASGASVDAARDGAESSESAPDGVALPTDAPSGDGQTVGRYAGQYGAAWTGTSRLGSRESGLLSATFSETGHVVIRLAAASGNPNKVIDETDLSPDGQITFVVQGVIDGGSTVITYTGSMRMEGTNAFGRGTWVSNTGSSGSWGAFRDTNQYDIPESEAAAACAAAVGVCHTGSGPADQPACRSALLCMAGYAASEDATCYESLLGLVVHPFAIATTSAECPSMPPAGFSGAGCTADLGACGQ